MLCIFGYITYYLLLLLSRFLIISYSRTTEITAPISASAQSAEGRRTPMHNIGAVTAIMADALLKDTPSQCNTSFYDVTDFRVPR